MNDLNVEGKWGQVKGRGKEVWGSLTDDDLDRTNGNLDRAVNRRSGRKSR